MVGKLSRKTNSISTDPTDRSKTEDMTEEPNGNGTVAGRGDDDDDDSSPPSTTHRRSSLAEFMLAQQEQESLMRIVDEGTSSEFGSSATGTGSGGKKQETTTTQLAQKESKHVFWSKVLVAVVLFVSTSVLGFFAYRFTQQEETQTFETQFEDLADEIIDQSVNNAFSSFSVLESFAKTVTSHGLVASQANNESWPLISLPHFEIRASDYLGISGAQQVAFAPIVDDAHREAWEDYTVANQQWIQAGIDLEYLLKSSVSSQEAEHGNDNGGNEQLLEEGEEEDEAHRNREGFASVGLAKPIQETIWRHAPLTHRPETELSKGPHVPLWQAYPAPRNSFVVNYNLMSSPEFAELINLSMTTRRAVLSSVVDNFVLYGNAQSIELDPKSVVIQPIFETFDTDAAIVGFFIIVIPWYIYFDNVLARGAGPLMCVLRNSCGESFSYQVLGDEATFMGSGDWHDNRYDYLEMSTEFLSFQQKGSREVKHHHFALHNSVQSVCDFTMHVYPTMEMENTYTSSWPIFVTMAVVGIFMFTSLVFLLYDFFVQRRQSIISATAMKTTAIVASLFPQEVHDRLFSSPLAGNSNNHRRSAHHAPKFRLRTFLSDEEKQKQGKQSGRKRRRQSVVKHDTQPIADLFPECTVMFCDIAGFTAWSSVREPSQVFVLLESVYAEFDAIANRRKVFKVETIGDSYLAVAGLPTPRRDHATVMVKFAHDCLVRMKCLTRSLELELGPGTEELTMRFGLHSGPVTAGVLRGEKTRFQLFGDTVNTASRMESTGLRDKIQVSEETAELIIAAGKEKWLQAREEKIVAKGKGELQTYWASPRAAPNESSSSDAGDTEREMDDLSRVTSTRHLHGSIALKTELDAKRKRLVHWVGEVMIKILKEIVARRTAAGGIMLKNPEDVFSTQFSFNDGIPLDEVQDIIMLPAFDGKVAKKHIDPSKVRLPESVLSQLHNYIAEVAILYRDNPFHNFDHATHVAMSVSKLLARIVAPESVDPTGQDGKTFESLRHDHTYGITSDPMTQFACVFAALIHDADHPGCPNTTLVRDQTPLAIKYNNRSVAEQNSLDLTWELLKADKYADLRACIYTNEEEMKRFRQLVVNSIIATDISDKKLSEQRKKRWNIAFHSKDAKGCGYEHCADGSCDSAAREAVNRKATIVIEHLIQASDVAHTMQHWHIYRKWNEKLFQEMYQAYLDGHLEKDPADSWYQGEIGFFDFYVIPLAKKLKECGVFGVSSAEYLNYAVANRREWEMRGQDVVKQFISKHVTQSRRSQPPE